MKTQLHRRARKAFTLIELMVVLAIMAIICATAVPNLYQMMKKEGLRRAVTDLRDVCGNARAGAILHPTSDVSVKFYPLERRYEIVGLPAEADDTKTVSEQKTTGIFPDDVVLELFEVNLDNAFDSSGDWTYDWVRVRFYPNGMSDEMMIVFRSEKGEHRKLTLEPTTALLLQGKMQ